jgi:hypothetical protein
LELGDICVIDLIEWRVPRSAGIVAVVRPADVGCGLRLADAWQAAGRKEQNQPAKNAQWMEGFHVPRVLKFQMEQYEANKPVVEFAK